VNSTRRGNTPLAPVSKCPDSRVEGAADSGLHQTCRSHLTQAWGTLVVNGMESEPASDKVLLTRAPHLVLDGAQFLAAMCRARRIVVCIPTGRDGGPSSSGSSRQLRPPTGGSISTPRSSASTRARTAPTVPLELLWTCTKPSR
jgi:Respiratory-chain NADH dehydrogenase 51 Kd subunit